MPKRQILVCLPMMLLGVTLWAAAQERKASEGSGSTTPPGASPSHAGVRSDPAARLEGERRFKANCGRCHEAPSKFPPRMMATIVRHMRVRATITDEDMRL